MTTTAGRERPNPSRIPEDSERAFETATARHSNDTYARMLSYPESLSARATGQHP